jgi:tetratricopeptide (TPR) repeat protein
LEADPAVRSDLTNRIAQDVEKIVPPLLAAEAYQRAEQLLELGAATDRGLSHYAAYLLARGQIDAKIAELAMRPDEPRTARFLAYLYRAEGNLPAARDAAKKAQAPELLHGILAEMGDWQALAKPLDSLAELDELFGGPDSAERLGYLAAFNRLAGKQEEFEKCVAAIQKLSEEKPDQMWNCAEALLINDRYSDGIEILRKRKQVSAFHLLVLQQRFREAFDMVGLKDSPRDASVAWFASFQAEGANEAEQANNRFLLGLQVALALQRVSEREEARRLMNSVAETAQGDRVRLTTLFKTEFDLGMEEEGLEHLSKRLAMPDSRSVFQLLFPAHVNAAQIWWKFLTEKHNQNSTAENARRLRILLIPGRFAESVAMLALLAPEFQEAALARPPGEQVTWLQTLGETWLLHGKPAESQAALEKAAEIGVTADVALQLGSLASKRLAWEKAAEWHAKAGAKDPQSPLGLYLEGYALKQAGQLAAGQKKVDLATLLPLGDGIKRRLLAIGLEQHGLSEEARLEWQRLMRVGPVNDWAVNEAAKNLGNALSGKDDLQTAELWQRPLLSALKANTMLTEVEGYLKLGHLIHKVRGRALLAAGKPDEAMAELRLAAAAVPGEITLPLDMAAKLEEADRRADADELFNGTFRVNLKSCEQWPQAATYHNNLAWLSAKCHRRLDDALAHARQAVALEPRSTAYLDTLAEVYFHRGDREEALKHARACLEMAPGDKQAQRQIDRFQSAEIPTAADKAEK